MAEQWNDYPDNLPDNLPGEGRAVRAKLLASILCIGPLVTYNSKREKKTKTCVISRVIPPEG